MESAAMATKRRRSLTVGRGTLARHRRFSGSHSALGGYWQNKAKRRKSRQQRGLKTWRRFRLWSYRTQERIRRSNSARRAGWTGYRPKVLRPWLRFVRRVRAVRSFIHYRYSVTQHRQQFVRHRRITRLIFRHELGLKAVYTKVNRRRLRLWQVSRGSSRLSLYRVRRSVPVVWPPRARLAYATKARSRLLPIVSARLGFSLVRLAYASRTLRLAYQIWRATAISHYSKGVADLVEVYAPTFFVSRGMGLIRESRTVVSGLVSQLRETELRDWGDFWHKLRAFKWFFEYKRWRRCYQLSLWFRRLRGYRRLKKERFYQHLLRLYFYYMGELSESNIRQMWLRYRRLDARYQMTGLRVHQMIQMRSSNLLAFMGVAPDSASALESARSGLVRINGSTKTSPAALIMAGDILQLNLGAAFNYLTLFSDLYWVRAEAQARFVGFVETLFSALLFFIVRWPRPYELGETDSRLNSRLLSQVVRLLPARTSKYASLPRTKRQYSLHQNVVKLMPYKYRGSRRDSAFSLLHFSENAPA